MSLGRQKDEAPEIMDLGLELMAIQPLLQVLLPRHLALVLEPVVDALPFQGTRGMLEQILVNLVSNARDAMPAGGTITLRAWSEPDGQGPLLEIQDEGVGIPEHLQEQMFQPFFTTKTTGTGTGLGLMCVKTMLDKAGGSISFSSSLHQGTRFQVRLPRAA
jgi:signal transduction histidine kinase